MHCESLYRKPKYSKSEEEPEGPAVTFCTHLSLLSRFSAACQVRLILKKSGIVGERRKPSFPSHPLGIRMQRIQHDVVLLRDQHRRNQHERSLRFRDEPVTYSSQRSRRWILLPVFWKRWDGSNHNLIGNLQGCDDEVVWHERLIDISSVFENCERAVRCCVANTRTDARPAASKEKRPLSIEGVFARKSPAGKPVNLHLTHTAVCDAP